MELFDKQVTLTISPFLIGLIAFAVILLIGSSIYLIVRQRKLEKEAKPKYGFLGKALYSIMLVLFLGGAIVVGIMSINDKEVINIEAKKNLTADIISNVLIEEDRYVHVSLKTAPIVEGKTWGPIGSKFTMYWTLNNADGDNFTYIESDKSNEDVSGIQVYIPKGSYKITLNVIYEDDTYIFTKRVKF